MILLVAYNARGNVRVCGTRCHNAIGDPAKSQCICGGVMRGIGDEGAKAVTPERLAELREQVVLLPGEYLQTRIGT